MRSITLDISCIHPIYHVWHTRLMEGWCTVVTAKKRTRKGISGPQRLRKANGRFVVTIPDEEVAAQGIEEGDLVFVTVRAAEVRPRLSPRLEALLDESLQENTETYRYLAGR